MGAEGHPRLGDLGLGESVRLLLSRVVLADERRRVGPDGPGDAADVSPRVEVAAARRVIIVLDICDDLFPDARPLTDLGQAEPGLMSRLGETFADAHGRLRCGIALRSAWFAERSWSWAPPSRLRLPEGPGAPKRRDRAVRASYPSEPS
jgi:hypothetical protein